MIVIDVETTGLDPQRNSIVSVGAVDFSNPTNQFYLENRISDGAEVVEAALKVNGFTLEGVIDLHKPSLEGAIKRFLAWARLIHDQTLAGENPSFDRSFVQAAILRYGLKYTFGHRVVDLHSISYAHVTGCGEAIPLRNNRTNIDTNWILGYVGIGPEPKPHNALTGAKMEAEAFSRLIHGRVLLDEFSHLSVPSYLKRSA